MARKFNVEQAVRTKVYPKIGIFAPSGGGKTYTALRLATGMIEELERITGKKYEIWFANNEGSRGKYYANEFNYKIIELEAPHEPELYYDLIDYAENSGVCGVLIIDWLSKEWAGAGGCLDIANNISGSFQNAWKNVSPRHRRLMDKLVDSHLTIISTMRGEDQYTMETDEKGKNKVVKLGIGAKTGKDFEYEFTCTFSLDQKTNCAEIFKDNTHLFENKPSMKLTEQDGINLIKWANESDIEPNKTNTQNNTSTTTDQLSITKANIKSKVEELVANGVSKEDISKTIKENFVDAKGKASANYNAIADVDTANKVLEALNNIKIGGENE
jgi:hypothetical protein